MSKPVRRSAGLLGTTLVVLATLLTAGAAPALAAQPGEESNWNQEISNNQPLRSGDTVSEARNLNNGNLLQVWRGYGNNNLYISVNHGVAVAWPTAETLAAPRAVWTEDGFYVFHTGTDGYIYYRNVPILASGGIGTLSHTWFRVPNNARTQPALSPSVTWLRGSEMYLTWGGASNTSQWGMFYNGGGWAPSDPLPRAQSWTANSVTFNEGWNQLVSIHTGTDGEIYWQRQTYGTGRWTDPVRLGDLPHSAAGTPAVALTSGGSGEVAVWLSGGATDPNTGSGPVLLTEIFANGAWAGTWSVATGVSSTAHNLWLTTVQNRIYLLNTYFTGYVYWKRSFQR
ncbi:hypothetical protein AMIS_25690 [Actinoplanes missouriensis 431]|uniref:Tachylectin 2 domain-containing protein n=1 Tax=Actinoplanes missouriensis (strain ATCC 14538 / DSM 43046 / CBS 188.64 / JCM 3121 / NBRC 102363 / NCIMB 12654 / NRRL B-3342 / UNCC 431) TaxID=512565 RepID=I0H452_ACTM4|nr:hypothetical protein [Actinoplanes missouriensis]BAL87789.1 hypothetical protein AMIS_25690 [Actinoplanes missouriensis 431]